MTQIHHKKQGLLSQHFDNSSNEVSLHYISVDWNYSMLVKRHEMITLQMKPLHLKCCARINIHIHYNVWSEITYSFPNVNVCTVGWISIFISHFGECVITYSNWD